MDRLRNVMLSRRGWVVALTVLAVAGVVFRWHWLVALGLASFVLDETDRCTDDWRHGQLDHALL
ncbi:MAG TPA: hypothetical protein VEM37_02410 [Nitrospiraceae bacterium]|nr:hypothetical protein [Nitrospiraceae bacterium]